MLLLTPFHRWRNWYVEMTCPKGTELAGGILASEPMLWFRPNTTTLASLASGRTWFTYQICPYSCVTLRR